MSSRRTTPATVTFTLLAVASAAFTLLQSLLNPVLPIIQQELHTDASTVTWVLTAWLLSASIATPLIGRVGDMLGRKRTLVAVLGAIALGSVVSALAPTIGVLIVGRVIQGVGAAIFPLAFGIIRDEFPASRISSAIGAMSAVIAVGSGLGTVLAGPVVALLGWRWLFWIPLVVVGITGALVLLLVPESSVTAGGRLNWVGALLLSGWLIALLLPLSEAHLWGWGSPIVISLFVLAAALLVAWVVVEVRSKNPLIDMRMMRLPGVWTTNLVALLFGAVMYSAFAFLPRYMQLPASTGYGFGASLTEAGLLLLPLLVAMAVTGFVSGPLSARISYKAQLTAGSVFVAASAIAFVLWHSTPAEVAVVSGVLGLGVGFAFAAMSALIVRSVPPTQTGVATGMNANIRLIGGSIGTALVSTIVTGDLGANGLPAESGFVNAFVLLAAIGVAAVAVCFVVPSARVRVRRPQAGPAAVEVPEKSLA